MGEPVRLALHHTTSSLRWTPDLIAAQGRQVVLIDCKSRRRRRGRGPRLAQADSR
ncbi:hypothetical protein AB0E62_39315 [Streptomyces sp. NPDC038707]|uniref:hypothetical protein n=1 Tax=Streptomyces sp. NPDC038707 TaxID=3154329 RepID=UPI0033E6D48C